jgi:hypothetical protein
MAALLLDADSLPANAVQGYTAGRIPGVTPDPDLPGILVYKRPAGKSGGHGVGWSEIPQVLFTRCKQETLPTSQVVVNADLIRW